MPEVVRPYRGVSADERRRQRRSQLLEAGLDVVGEVGVADTTVDLVCKRAGLSKRYFYESFADREALLTAVLTGVFDAVRSSLETALTDAPSAAEERMTLLVTATVEAIATDPRVSRLWVEANHHPALEQHRSEAYAEFADLLVSILLPGREDDPAAQSAFVLVVAGTTEVLRRWLADGSPGSPAGIVDVLRRVGLAVTGEFG
ncbi:MULTISPECIES: TetR/AcrR family transcriptional regulator [Amycolatopsis]|uniref:TetR/AcrR family transcriptional regulator n=1 Tax=Amycolatopsis albidoflavus TaxID=102226 RepID=A0ABW5IER5_9PSEU